MRAVGAGGALRPHDERRLAGVETLPVRIYSYVYFVLLLCFMPTGRRRLTGVETLSLSFFTLLFVIPR